MLTLLSAVYNCFKQYQHYLKKIHVAVVYAEEIFFLLNLMRPICKSFLMTLSGIYVCDVTNYLTADYTHVHSFSEMCLLVTVQV